ncbi:hypothetical protein ACHAWC_010522 [Mediolabrus comicus]
MSFFSLDSNFAITFNAFFRSFFSVLTFASASDLCSLRSSTVFVKAALLSVILEIMNAVVGISESCIFLSYDCTKGFSLHLHLAFLLFKLCNITNELLV